MCKETGCIALCAAESAFKHRRVEVGKKAADVQLLLVSTIATLFCGARTRLEAIGSGFAVGRRFELFGEISRTTRGKAVLLVQFVTCVAYRQRAPKGIYS